MINCYHFGYYYVIIVSHFLNFRLDEVQTHLCNSYMSIYATVLTDPKYFQESMGQKKGYSLSKTQAIKLHSVNVFHF